MLTIAPSTKLLACSRCQYMTKVVLIDPTNPEYVLCKHCVKYALEQMEKMDSQYEINS